MIQILVPCLVTHTKRILSCVLVLRIKVWAQPLDRTDHPIRTVRQAKEIIQSASGLSAVSGSLLVSGLKGSLVGTRIWVNMPDRRSWGVKFGH